MTRDTALRASDILYKIDLYEDHIDNITMNCMYNDPTDEVEHVDKTLTAIYQETINKIQTEIDKLNKELEEL